MVQGARSTPRRAVAHPVDCGTPDVRLGPAVEERLLDGLAVPFPAAAGAIPIRPRAAGQTVLGLALRAPEGAVAGETLHLDLIERDQRRGLVVGGLAVELRIRRRARRRALGPKPEAT